MVLVGAGKEIIARNRFIRNKPSAACVYVRAMAMGRPPLRTDPVKLNLFLDRTLRDQLRAFAHEEGLSVGQLVQRWVKEETLKRKAAQPSSPLEIANHLVALIAHKHKGKKGQPSGTSGKP